MSRVYCSEKRDRCYIRKFDHEAAVVMYAGGMSISAIGREFGVTPAAIRRVVDPAARKRMHEAALQWHRNHREPCKGGCGRLVWTTTHPEAKGFCRSCFGLTRRTSIRPDTLRCSRCEEWKPDDAFPLSRTKKARRGRHSFCRVCQTLERREHRHRARAAA